MVKNRMNNNYPTIDRSDDRTIYSNKSIDPSARTYSSENNNFYNKMKSYVNDLNKFTEKPTGKNPVTLNRYDNKALNLVLPNKSLPEFQVNALKEIKIYANELNIDIKVYVTSGK